MEGRAMTDDSGKRPRGRPVTRVIEPIPDTLENLAQAVVRPRSKAERERIIRAARQAVG